MIVYDPGSQAGGASPSPQAGQKHAVSVPSRTTGASAILERPRGVETRSHAAHFAASETSAPAASQTSFNRVKVAVRCRPPFEEEGLDSSIAILDSRSPLLPQTVGQLPVDLQRKVHTSPSLSAPHSYALHVTAPAGSSNGASSKQLTTREFAFDAVFGPSSTNEGLYQHLAGPIVESVLKEGVNGSILCYGQTGSGKTHTLGTLTRVKGENGLIPRALSHVFGFLSLNSAKAQAQQAAAKIRQAAEGSDEAAAAGADEPLVPSYHVSLSFCQLYLDNCYDLLASPSSSSSSSSSGSAGYSHGASVGPHGAHPLSSPFGPAGGAVAGGGGSSSGHSTPRYRSGVATPSTALSSSASSSSSSFFNHLRSGGNGGNSGGNGGTTTPSTATGSFPGSPSRPSTSSRSRSRSAGRSGAAGRGHAHAVGSSNVGLPGMVPLPVREDAARGFFVDGLSEWSVSSFSEALDLLNWGLENRVLGATKMNATSSRSHTLLTIRIEARFPVRVPLAHRRVGDRGESDATTTGVGSSTGGVGGAYISRRSQLVMVDLAGSERVRRTSSRGMRLEEARSINASLHSLGQVIVALSSQSEYQQHCPWRDSKLTKLLHGSLGGNCNTCLIATVSPALNDAQESLSTLQFASRCMRVAASPVSLQQSLGGVAGSGAGAAGQNGLAELAARLQTRLSQVEGEHALVLTATEERYERAIRDLSAQLTEAQSQVQLQTQRADEAAAFALASVSARGGSGSSGAGAAVVMTGEDKASLAACFRAAIASFNSTLAALLWVLLRASRASSSWKTAIEKAKEEAGSAQLEEERGSSTARAAFQRSIAAALSSVHLTYSGGNASSVSSHADGGSISEDKAVALGLLKDEGSGTVVGLLSPPAVPAGSALSGLSQAILNGQSASSAEVVDALARALAAGAAGSGTGGDALVSHPPVESLLASSSLPSFLVDLERCTKANVARLNALLACKDASLEELKRSLAACEANLRTKEQDVGNERYVLRFLAESAETLKAENAALRAKLGLGTGAPCSALVPLSSPLPSAIDPLPSSASSGLSTNGSFFSSSASDGAAAVVDSDTSLFGADAAFANEGAIVASANQPRQSQRQESPTRTAPLVSSPPSSTVVSGTATAIAAAVATIEALAAKPSSPRTAATAPFPKAIGKPPLPPSALSRPSSTNSLLRAGATGVVAIGPAVPSDDEDDVETTRRQGDAKHSSREEGLAGGEDEDEEDEIEAIVGHRYLLPDAAGDPTAKPRLLYLVHWRGSNPDGSEDEYFSREDLLQDYPAVVKRYEEERRSRMMAMTTGAPGGMSGMANGLSR